MDPEYGLGAPEAPGEQLRAVISEGEATLQDEGGAPGCLLWTLLIPFHYVLNCKCPQAGIGKPALCKGHLPPTGYSSPVSPSPFSPLVLGPWRPRGDRAVVHTLEKFSGWAQVSRGANCARHNRRHWASSHRANWL